MSNNDFKSEIDKGERFEFGENWREYLTNLQEKHIEEAEKSLKLMLEVDNLKGKKFLDAGSGSGLFSLAARRLGAQVFSFDYDPSSVGCTQELKKRFFNDDAQWKIEQGSVLDKHFLENLGKFDIVYSWGVLHHTGDMWRALELIAPLVKSNGGKLFIALYNDQGKTSERWKWLKKFYCSSSKLVQSIIVWVFALKFWGLKMIKDLVVRGNPFYRWNQYYLNRGMSAWRDIIDWVGGYPFEVASVETIFNFYREKGFVLNKLKTNSGLGNNEFLFELKEKN